MARVDDAVSVAGGSFSAIAPDGRTPPVEIETGPSPGAAVIWLHGLGADGHDFEPIIPQLGLSEAPAVRFVFPHAPLRAVTINAGFVMRAWYDLALTEGGLWQNDEHLGEAEHTVVALIRRENARGIPAGRIVLAGFSQGANVVLHAGLHYPEPLAGILALSAPVLDAARLGAEVTAANRSVPVFLAHGTQDTLVPFGVAREAREALAQAGLTLRWQQYVMGHGVCAEEIADIRDWLNDRFCRSQ